MAEEEKFDEILTINECAKLLKVSPWLIYDLVSQERVPGKIFARKVGRSWRILRTEIDRFLQEEAGRPYQLTLRPEEK
jgi:excisionase family DNA binding protein